MKPLEIARNHLDLAKREVSGVKAKIPEIERHKHYILTNILQSYLDIQLLERILNAEDQSKPTNNEVQLERPLGIGA